MCNAPVVPMGEPEMSFPFPAPPAIPSVRIKQREYYLRPTHHDAPSHANTSFIWKYVHDQQSNHGLARQRTPQISWAAVDQRHGMNVLLIGTGGSNGFDTHIRYYVQIYYFR